MSEDLVKRLRAEAKEFYGMTGELSDSELFVLNEDSLWLAADALEAKDARIAELEGSYASACQRADEAEARNEFFLGIIAEMEALLKKAGTK